MNTALLRVFNFLPRMLLWVAFTSMAVGAYVDSYYDPHGPPPTAVKQVFEQANTLPEALWALKDAPLEQTFWRLMRDRAEGKPNLTSEDRHRIEIAREILLNHPDLENYVSRNLKHMGEVLVEGFRNEQYQKANRVEYDISRVLYLNFLGYAAHLPDDRAFRLIGPFLFSLYHPPIDHGDVMESSPAAKAQGWLELLAQERLHEPIPEDIAGARQWWRANEHRFAAKVAAPETSAPIQSLLRPDPISSAIEKSSPNETTSPTNLGQRGSRRWVFPVILIIAFAIVLSAKKRGRS